MREATIPSKESTFGKAALSSACLKSNILSAENMRRLIGAPAFDQHPGKIWSIIVPAGHTTEDAEFAISLGRYKLTVTERVVFIKPACEKSFE